MISKFNGILRAVQFRLPPYKTLRSSTLILSSFGLSHSLVSSVNRKCFLLSNRKKRACSSSSEKRSTKTMNYLKRLTNGINAGDVKKLQDAGIHTCNGLMMHTKKNLTGIKGLSEAKVDKICEAAEKIVNFGYMTGSDALLKRKSVVRITTGSQALDDLLGGGIETAAITEAFGEFRSGKTQLAHTLCVTTQLPTSMKGGNGKVAYIDTEGTFRPDRIVQIAERFGMDPGAVLDNIIYARAYTYEHQHNLLLGLAAKMSEEPFKILVSMSAYFIVRFESMSSFSGAYRCFQIVDSIIALFRVDFTGRGELADRQQKLAQMLSRIIKIAEEFNVAVYMTNQVISDPGGGMFISDPKKPAGGHVLAHAVTIRLSFRKGKGEQRVCKITPGGVADAKD
ncbi:hypothetical protein IGI04_003137 [Brassica rapa subsp. trilocularis]|uniref:RecA family profile 1 domain-containing protein n=1 Tax=Brassica rapa subsp. trilocularis TaxID=1813537 RepID=A0ABQ7NZK5_BRACM|nr:hypothetical protein IGI04_003137 [Brassica rapa subsp. trilocularis]